MKMWIAGEYLEQQEFSLNVCTKEIGCSQCGSQFGISFKMKHHLIIWSGIILPDVKNLCQNKNEWKCISKQKPVHGGL